MMKYIMEKGFRPMVDDATDKVLRGVIDVVEMIDTVDVTDRIL
jgi:hypothetical protein